VWSGNPTKICYAKYRGIKADNSFLSLYPKIFDYSLGGYYHRERCARTRRYYKKGGYYLMIKGATVYFSQYLKNIFFDYSLGGYSHRERWPRTRRNSYEHKGSREGEKKTWTSSLLSSEGVYINQGWITRIFPELKQSNKAATYDSWVASSRQSLNAMIKIYHEGKTPGSVLCGLVYAHGCALLEIIRVYDAKKILVDALGTLRTTGTLFL
jgi:hypothetical protein